MKQDGKWYREVKWLGVYKLIECGTNRTPHSFAWSGSIPCTGERKCIYCGKPEKDDR